MSAVLLLQIGWTRNVELLTRAIEGPIPAPGTTVYLGILDEPLPEGILEQQTSRLFAEVKSLIVDYSDESTHYVILERTRNWGEAIPFLLNHGWEAAQLPEWLIEELS